MEENNINENAMLDAMMQDIEGIGSVEEEVVVDDEYGIQDNFNTDSMEVLAGEGVVENVYSENS